eukprot:SAG11_NODE_1439_length_4907_cov_2.082571_6_plen_59_part_00
MHVSGDGIAPGGGAQISVTFNESCHININTTVLRRCLTYSLDLVSALRQGLAMCSSLS